MAFTAADLSAIDRAIASGQLTIRAADGATVTYRTTAELIAARGVIVQEIAAQEAAASGRRRSSPRHQLASFSD